MPQTHRIAPDCNVAGGCATSTPNGTVYANNILITVNGSIGTSHPPCPAPSPPHCAGNWTTANGGPTVFAENIPINKMGDADTCGHPRAAGSPNVFNDAFKGGGPMFDNSVPFNVQVPPGGQPSPPAGFTNTAADLYVLENNDVPEEINPPPPGTDFAPTTEEEVDPEQPPPNVPPSQDCSTVDALPASFNWSTEPGATTFSAFAASFQLSPNYTVYDLTIAPAVSTYSFSSNVTQASGLSQKQILQNLCFLAKTVLEPLLASYPGFTITSCFRNKSGGSQHNKGQAVDIQYLGFHNSNAKQLYYDHSKVLRDNIDYDQIILEYFGRNPWIHLSSNSSGHRKSVLTQVSSSSYAGGLRLLG